MRPLVFISASNEGLSIARAIRTQLKDSAEITISGENDLGAGGRADTNRASFQYDFAIFVLTPNDLAQSQSELSSPHRDDILFEIGMFIGRLGSSRTFLVYDEDNQIIIPQRLTAARLAPFKGSRTDGNMTSAVGESCDLIRHELTTQKGIVIPAAIKEAAEAQAKQASEVFQQVVKARVGTSSDSSWIKTEILDLEGTAIIKRGWEGIKVSPDVMVSRIPGFLRIGTQGGKILKPPSLEPVSFEKPVELTVTSKKRNAPLCEFYVSITNALTHLDPPLNFQHVSEVSKFCLMTQEEVDKVNKGKEFKYEFLGLRLDMPTGKMSLEVVFPEGYDAKCYAGVFFGTLRSNHGPELKRVDGGFSRNSRGAVFDIQDPMLGFNYLIYWTSPSQREVDKLRT